MGLAQIYSRACAGVEAPQITVEVHLSGGLPRTQIVGSIEPKARVSLATERAPRLTLAGNSVGSQVPILDDSL